MKRFLLLLPVLFLVGLVHAADKNNVLLHPGETLYLRFDASSRKISLASVGKEADATAQVVVSLAKDQDQNGMRKMKIENKFSRDLIYKVEVRSFSLKREMRVPTTPVVAQKVAFEDYPIGVDELAFYDFKLAK